MMRALLWAFRVLGPLSLVRFAAARVREIVAEARCILTNRHAWRHLGSGFVCKRCDVAMMEIEVYDGGGFRRVQVLLGPVTRTALADFLIEGPRAAVPAESTEVRIDESA